MGYHVYKVIEDNKLVRINGFADRQEAIDYATLYASQIREAEDRKVSVVDGDTEAVVWSVGFSNSGSDDEADVECKKEPSIPDEIRAKRNNQNKPRIGLIPLITMIDEAEIWEAGIAEYDMWNWTKGMSWMIVIDSLLRHVARFQAGEDLDPKSGKPHTHHIACNVRMLCTYEKTHPELDDRPKGIFDAFLEKLK